MYIDDCVKGITRITHSDILEPINLGSSELVSINQLVDIAEEIAGIKLNRTYKLDAPRGVAGRNSDNTRIRQYLGWEPDTRLRDGMELTYRWIWEQFTSKYDAKSALTTSTSTFSHGAKPLPGDGYNPESRHMDTWRQGNPRGVQHPRPPERRPERGQERQGAREEDESEGQAEPQSQERQEGVAPGGEEEDRQAGRKEQAPVVSYAAFSHRGTARQSRN